MLTNLPPLLQLNDTVLDTVQQALRRGDEEIQLEPRVFDVLCYLLAHRERYVSLQELHQQVWAGRVVSDTAVRRTISKLRAQLQDTNLEQPVFIRSGMKRGYQWLVEPVAVQEGAALAEPAGPLAVANPAMSGNHSFSMAAHTTDAAELDQAYVRPLFAVTHRRWLMMASLGVLALLLLWGFFHNWQRTDTELPLVMPYEVLLDIPGRKGSLTVSNDGEQLAFTGTLGNTPGLFLQQTKTGAVQRIPTAMDNVWAAGFVQQGRSIMYSALDDTGSQLYLQQLDDLSQSPRRIYSSDFIYVSDFLDLGDDQILIAANLQGTRSLIYYLYQLKQGSWRPFSISSQSSIYDYSARLSPDGKQIALLRSYDSATFVRVLLFDASSHELLQQIPLATDFHSLEWLDDQQLLLARVGESHLYRFDISNQQLDQVAIAASWQQLQRSKSGDWFGITYPRAEPGRFYRQQLGLSARPERLFNLPDTTEQLVFSQQAGWYWLVEQHEQQSVLLQYHGQSGQKEQVYATPERLRIIQQHGSRLLIFLLEQRRLAVLDTASGALHYLSSVQQKVDHHQAYMSEAAVYFAEERSGLWQVSRYDLVQNQQDVFLPGYRFLAPWQQQYVALDQQGQYWLLSADLEPLKPLPLQVKPDLFPVRSMVYNDKIIAVTMQFDSGYHAYQLDLATMQVTYIELPQDFRALLHFSVADNQLLYREHPINSSEVVRLKGVPLQ